MVLLIDSDDVLATELDVPRVVYASYTSTSTAAHNARCKILQSNSDNGIDQSYIPTIQVTSTSAVLWVFRILQGDVEVEGTLGFLGNLSYDGLQLQEPPQVLTPAHLYPCSEECSYLPAPCANCLNPPSTSSAPPPPSTSSASRLPRRPLRGVWSTFLQAVRGWIIADIVTRSDHVSGRTINRLKDGFLLGHAPSKLSTTNEWTAGWEGRIKSKPLVYVYINLHLSNEKLLIHPTLHPTPFIPLTTKGLQQGTPITLLPYGTPAYYLSTYSGSTSALTKQFREALQGCGVSPKLTTYAIIWIPVENAHGEEKGLTAIYPAELCVSFIPTPGTVPSLAFRSSATTTPTSAAPSPFPTISGPWTPYGRSLLPIIPALPPPLQPSPTVGHVVPPGFSAPSPSPAVVLGASSYIPTPPATHANSANLPVPLSATVPTSPYSANHPASSFPPFIPPPYALSVTPNERLALSLSRSYSLTFKAKRQSQHNSTFSSIQTSLPKLPDTIINLTHATEASGFVDMTAKEREKERERLRNGGKQAQENQQAPAASASQPTPRTAQAQAPVPYPPTVQIPYPNATQASSAQPYPSQPFPQSTFYPSPPDPQATPMMPLKVEMPIVPKQPLTVPLQPLARENIDIKDEDSMGMDDDDDLFGASPPPSAENVEAEAEVEAVAVVEVEVVPKVEQVSTPVPPTNTVEVDVKPPPESNDEWADMNMDWDMSLDMDMDMGMGMGMDMSTNMDVFGFGSSSSSDTKIISSSLPAGNRSLQMQTSIIPTSVSTTRSVPATTTVASVSMSKAMSFEDDITDDDYNWFDTHDSGGARDNESTSGFMGAGASGSLDAGATLFSAISASHPSAHSIQPLSGMHPPPVPSHAHQGFSFAPSPASASASPWTSHAHYGHGETPGATSDTMGTPSVALSMTASGDAFPLSPPEEGMAMGIGMLVGTPMSGVPQTPNTARWGTGWTVQLESPFSSPERRAAASARATADGRRLSSFDPIPFAASHRVSDGKYTCGKFMLPSPPAEGDDEDGYFSSAMVNANGKRLNDDDGSTGLSPALKGLKLKYDKKTDPRIAVVAQLRLRRVKRRPNSTLAIPVPRTETPRWVKEWEEGMKGPLPMSPASMKFDSDDDNSASDEDDSDDDLFDIGTGASSPVPEFSRPATPLPAYIPPGPTLLSSHFQHTHLLPLSTPLRSPGTRHEESQLNHLGAGAINAAAASVPTPVSPAAMLGAAAEKSKGLEAAAEMVAREVVENSLWGEIWTMHLCFGKHAGLSGSEQRAVSDMSIDDGLNAAMGPELAKQQIWITDIEAVKVLLSGVKGVKGLISMAHLFDPIDPSTSAPISSASRKVYPLQPPHLAVGKGDGVVEILPTALRFWEKLGLGPKYGQKDVTAFVLFEDGGEWREQRVEAWLSNISAVYQRKSLGNLIPGSSSSCTRDGLKPLKFDTSFRKNLASFVSSLPAAQTNFIFFVVIPSTALTLSSPMLRQVLASLKKAIKTYSEAQIVFQLVPEEMLLGNMDSSSVEDLGTEQICYSVYNRILQPVERSMSRQFFEHGIRVRNYFQEPFATLARAPSENKVTYVASTRTSLDVMDRHTLLHVGYQVSYCGKWILAAIIDQRGEAHDLGVWLTQTHSSDEEDALSDELYAVSKVWDFAMRLAEKADVEWRIVFAKLGLMTTAELDAWTAHLATSLQVSSSRTPVHVSLVSVETSAPWIILPKRPRPTSLSSSHSSSSLNKAPSLSRSSSLPSKSSSKNGIQYYVDGSQTTYALFHRCSPTFARAPTMESVGITTSIVTDSPPERSEHTLELPVLPLCSSTLIRIPASPSPSASAITPNMIDLHLLHTASSRGCTYLPSRTRGSDVPVSPASQQPTSSVHWGLMNDILHSYHALSILSESRSKLSGVNTLLPFHLGAVEAMRNALSFGRVQTDGYD